MIRTSHTISAATLLLAAGCYTGIDRGAAVADDSTGAADSASGSGSGSDSDGETDGPAEAAVSPSGLSRLTRIEYERTVTAIFGDEIAALVDFGGLPADGKIGRFESNADLNVNIDVIDAYRLIAEQIGEAAGARATTLLGCEESAPCVEAFIRDWGLLIYRRPLSDAEVGIFVDFWNTERADGTLADAMRMTVSAFLQTPDFLYRLERGEPDADGAVRLLTGYEVATRLSFFLWKSGPDLELLDAAGAGELDTPEGIAGHTERLLADPRADYTLLRFHASWLGIDGLGAQVVDATAFPAFEELRDDMVAETEQFVLHLFREDDAQVSTMFSADWSFASPELAAFYGDGVASNAGDGSIVLDPSQRMGVLTHASYLTSHARTPTRAAIYRGKSILVDVFCLSLVPPPDAATNVEFDSSRPAREQIEMATGGGSCMGCHQLINPLGFLFENYDGIGAWRTMEGEFPIDAVATIVGTDIDGEYANATALMAKLAHSPLVEECVSRQWMRFALSRPEGELDDPSIAAVAAAAGGDMRAMIPALTQTDTFRYRRLPE
jgi:hypothetical protein